MADWTDPRDTHFKTYLERLTWGPPNEHGTRQCMNQALARERFSYYAFTRDNEYFGKDCGYTKWEDVLEAGRNYLVGRDVPLKEFIRKHTSSLNLWQRAAFTWCMANPECALELKPERYGHELKGFAKRLYVIQARGEYVQFGLPYHDWGGEKHWVSKNGKTKILINVD